MTYHKIVNGQRIDLTPEEVQELEAMWAENAARPPAPPASITRRQCALELLTRGLITPEEALAMTKSADVPAAVAMVFAGMSPEARILAEIDFAATNYYRANTLLSQMGLTDAQLDEFFIAAALR